MGKAVQYLFLFVASVFLGVVFWLSSIDNDIHISRTVEVNADIEKVWANINEYKNFTVWSPWTNIDPTAKVSFKDNPGGIGSFYRWKGEVIGSGTIEHTKISSKKLLEQKIIYEVPYRAEFKLKWTLEEKKGAVVVNWEMIGKVPFFLRFLTPKLRPILDNDFSRGLLMFKDLCEDGVINSKVEIKGIVKAPAIIFIGKSTTCSMDDLEMNIKKQFFALITYSFQYKLNPPKKALTIYKKLDLGGGLCEFTSGFSVPSHQIIHGDEFEKQIIPVSKSIKIVFTGHFKHDPNGWMAALRYAQMKKLTIRPDISPYEVYYKNPNALNSFSDLMTEIYIPIK